MLVLKPLNECINMDVYFMYQEIPDKELGSENEIFGKKYNEFLDICNNYIEEEKIINKKIDTTTKRFILYDELIPIGELGIRTTQNDFWCNRGSQIFYKIRLSKRGKGYGNKILEYGLIEAKKLGFKKIRINCSNDNIKSKKVIINNGGRLDIKDYKTKNGISSSYVIEL